MPEKKRQHTVPQFYLRLFSPDDRRKTIDLYHVPSSRFVRGASIRNQAYSDYFYGKDLSNEEALHKIEQGVAPTIKAIIESETLPDQKSKQYNSLLFFILLLKARTEAAAEEVDEIADATAKMLLSQDPRIQEDLTKYRIRSKNPSAVSLGIMATAVPLVVDLKCCLLINRRNRVFLTSDNPVACYNRLMEIKNPPVSCSSLPCKGLQMFVPLSPRHQLLFFDPAVYVLDGKNDPIYIMRKDSDIKTVNRLQYLLAHEHLYFGSETKEEEMRSFKSTSQHLRTARMIDVEKCQVVDEPDRTIYAFHPIDLRCGLEFPFLPILPEAMQYRLENKGAHVRDERLCRLHLEFAELVVKGRYGAADWSAFLRDRGLLSES